MSSPSNFTGSRFLRHAGAVLLISSLIACGGGGGGGSKGSKAPTPASSSSSSAVLSSSSSSSVSSVPVAIAPSVDAGEAASIVTGKSFTFAATATAGDDKQLVSFLWEQIGNAAVTVDIVDASQLATSFTAPYVSKDVVINFRLTVTDSEGLTASDSVAITIKSDPDAPVAGVKFPPSKGIYTNPEISVFGKASVKDDAKLAKVTVSSSLGEVSAEINNSGEWRAKNLMVPVGESNFVVTVRVEDSIGRVTIEDLQLTSLSNASVGGGEAWGRTASIVYENTRNTLWLLVTGQHVSDTKIIPVDVKTGHRGASILSEPIPAAQMTLDWVGNSFLVVGAVIDKSASLYSVSRISGRVEELSGEKKGTGFDFGLATGGITSVIGNNIYVANNSTQIQVITAI